MVAKLKDLNKQEYKQYLKMAIVEPRCVRAYMVNLVIDADANWETETTRDRYYTRAVNIIATCDAAFRHKAIAHRGKTI